MIGLTRDIRVCIIRRSAAGDRTHRNIYVYVYTYIDTYIHTNNTPIHSMDISTRDRPVQCQGVRPVYAGSESELSLYKMLFYFLKLYCGSQSSFYCPPPQCKTYPVAMPLHGYCAIYAPPPPPPVYAIHHTILVMAISCKGQV